MRRVGAMAALVGLVLTMVAIIVSAGPATAAANPGLVCNNQQNRPEKDCVGDKNHGTIAASFDTAGNLVFDLDAASGFSGWRQIYICVGTGDTPTNRADCQGNTPTVLRPDAAGGDQYDVTDVEPDSTITEHAKDVTFGECATGITAVVDAGALPPGGFNWIVHVNSCEGTTDEAFGTAQTPDDDDEGFTYACAAPTGVTADGATLRGTTSDPAVTSAEFSFTSPAEETRSFSGVEDPDDDGLWSVTVAGLAPETAYEYEVAFFAGGEEVGSADDCSFATPRGPDSYACAAPTDVTASSATLRGSTTDELVDAATFALNSTNGSVEVAGAEVGDSNDWKAEATGLAAETEYTYTVAFADDGTDHGTGSGAACRFKTLAAASTLAPGPGPGPGPDATVTASPQADDSRVAGIVLTAETPNVAAVATVAAAPVSAAPAVAATPLARTGVSIDLLLPVGLGLVLFGAGTVLLGRRQELAIVRRPPGQHYR